MGQIRESLFKVTLIALLLHLSVQSFPCFRAGVLEDNLSLKFSKIVKS